MQSPARMRLHRQQALTAALLSGSSRAAPATAETGKRKAQRPPERASKAKRALGALLPVLPASSCLPTLSALLLTMRSPEPAGLLRSQFNQFLPAAFGVIVLAGILRTLCGRRKARGAHCVTAGGGWCAGRDGQRPALGHHQANGSMPRAQAASISCHLTFAVSVAGARRRRAWRRSRRPRMR